MTTARFSSLERWIMLVASAWLVTGLQLDAYAHATTPQLETFWTPWHAVLYSGIAASGLTLVWLLRSRLPRIPTYETVLALPNALRVPLLGMAFLLVGGGVDTLWHNIFGIERGLEIFVSPSHEFIILGMVLVAVGPAMMTAAESGPRLSPGDGTLVTISALLTVLPLHIYSLHANMLGTIFLGDGDNPVRIYSQDAQIMHGFLFTTALLLLPIVLIGRRWPVPFGVPTVLVAVPALAMHLMFLSESPWWMSLTVAAAAAGTELVVRVVGPLLPLPPSGSWFVLGLTAPVMVWGTLFVVGDLEIGVGWNVHIVSGLLTFVALVGGGTVLVARNIRPPAPVQAVTSAPPTASPSSAVSPAVSSPAASSPASGSSAAGSSADATSSASGSSAASDSSSAGTTAP